MFTQDIGVLVAFWAGVTSFFSPCILPLIPVYIMYITGTTTEEDLKTHKFFVLSRTFGFIIGFTFIFLLLGLSATFLGQIFNRNRDLFFNISGWVMIFFGLNMLGLFRIKGLKIPQLIKPPTKVTSFFGSVLMGLAFGAGWSPCFGPVLGAILFYASTSNSLMGGTYLLLIYALGMAVPFLLTAIFIQRFNKFLSRMEKWMVYLPKISGIVLIIFGILILTNQLTNLNKLFF